jgi:hypothetical protein
MILANPISIGPAALISLDVESPIDSCYNNILLAKSLGAKERIGIERAIEVSEMYDIPFTLFCTGHALLKGCKEHKLLISIVKKNNRYGFRAGKYLWHGLDPASNYVEYPEFYYGDLIEEITNHKIKCEIASHSFSHIPYPLVDDETVFRDLNRSIEAFSHYDLKPSSLAFPYNLAVKNQLFSSLSKFGIRTCRVGHRTIRAISLIDEILLINTTVTDFGIDSLYWWTRIIDLFSKKRTFLSWYLHPKVISEDKAYILFKEVVKYLVLKEVSFLTFRDLRQLLIKEKIR